MNNQEMYDKEGVSQDRMLDSIALNLFMEYQNAHKELGILKPNRRVAIDYLLLVSEGHEKYLMAHQTYLNNAWLLILKINNEMNRTSEKPENEERLQKRF